MYSVAEGEIQSRQKMSQTLLLAQKRYQNVSNAASLNGIKVKAQVNTMLATAIQSPNQKMFFS